MEDVQKIILEQMKEIREDVREMRREMGSLKVKVATIGSIFGVLGAYIKSKLGN